jgi:hypothetical protein
MSSLWHPCGIQRYSDGMVRFPLPLASLQ